MIRFWGPYWHRNWINGNILGSSLCSKENFSYPLPRPSTVFSSLFPLSLFYLGWRSKRLLPETSQRRIKVKALAWFPGDTLDWKGCEGARWEETAKGRMKQWLHWSCFTFCHRSILRKEGFIGSEFGSKCSILEGVSVAVRGVVGRSGLAGRMWMRLFPFGWSREQK